MTYRVAAFADGASEPSVTVDWDTLSEAVDSFIVMVETSGGEFTKKQVAIMLKLMLGDYIHNTFQMLSSDEQTVITITKVTVGIPT